MTKTINTTCCISDGGPAGLMFEYLLARSGVDVTVIENTRTSCAIFAATQFTLPPCKLWMS
jgi:2-polyprenyl-6-methoxyphenol hydroxylase-like FAD-dependent oxidoreductase